MSALRVAKVNTLKSGAKGNIGVRVRKLIENPERLEQLLALEKKRRGLAADRLAFVGLANVTEHWWCTQKAVLKSRAEEGKFFYPYLHDRIVCAHRLGLIKKLPRNDEILLDIGREITLAERERLFESAVKDIEIVKEYAEIVDRNGKRRALINPDLPEEQRKDYGKMARAKGAQIISGSLSEDPLLRGTRAHLSPPEKYPSFRWAFPWQGYTVVGIPDGLTSQFVYEFKTTGSRYLLNFLKPVALAQADLYGYFFMRPRKRVQIRILQEGKVETFEEPINGNRAGETLNAFARVERGEPAHPPKAWKCRKCEYRMICPIRQA